jgi:PAS domain S-box-containing protein
LVNLSWGALHAGLQSVLETALDAVVVMNVQGHVIGWNRHASSCFGWTADEAIGRPLSELIVPPSLRHAHERGLAHYLATGEGPVLDRRVEVTALDRNGREFPVELSITATRQFGEPMFVGFLRDISERHALADRQVRRLQESDHRVKNILAVVAAIAKQTTVASSDLESFEQAFTGRLHSLARAHRMLVGSAATEIGLSVLAEQVLGADVRAGRATFHGPELMLSGRQVLGLSMVLHELYTNAVKYGAFCTDQGSVALEWAEKDGLVELHWRESGATCDGPQTGSGYGGRMIEMSVRSDLDGSIERDWRPEGLLVTLRFPLELQISGSD